jgi:hypothetical protein
MSMQKPNEFATSLTSKKKNDDSDHFRPEELMELSGDLSSKMAGAIKDFDKINLETQILSINAAVEASRAGEAGASFAIVANHMKELSLRTGEVADDLTNNVQVALKKINDFSSILSNQVRGTRLSDLALNNIDLIDRNLYERSCDVRWWATDSSVWHACSEASLDNTQHACERLGVILDAYTVYCDLVLCNIEGQVIANGRPNKYDSIGSDCSKEQWFTQSLHSQSGDEFGFQPVHNSSLVDNQAVLAYSCSVRAQGHANGEVLGVLGILFNWDALAGVILEQTQLTSEEWKRTRICIVDDDARILADTQSGHGHKVLDLPDIKNFFKESKIFKSINYHGNETLIAYAKAPGYETYTTGWHSFIIQANR